VKPEEKKNVAAVVFLAAAILVCNYMLFARSIGFEIRRLREEIVEIENKKRAALSLLRRMKQIRAKRESVKKEIERLKRLLPKEKDLPGLIRAIAALAEMSGVDLNRVEMGREVAYPEKHYAAVNIKVSFTSTYPQLVEFLERVDSLDRLVKPEKLNVRTKQMSDNPLLTVSGLLQTYRYIEGMEKGKGR